MIQQTEAIVLKITPYNDRYSIAKLYTLGFGRVDYILPRTKRKNSKINSTEFFPLSILDLEVEHLLSHDIQRLKEATCAYPLYGLTTDINKLSISFFIAELLTYVLQEPEADPDCYNFIKGSIIKLDRMTTSVANFHIAFMFGLTHYLGFFPNLSNIGDHHYFDMQNGTFSSSPKAGVCLNATKSDLLVKLCKINYDNMQLFKFSSADRNEIIDNILTYYRMHLYNFPKLKSPEVLKSIEM